MAIISAAEFKVWKGISASTYDAQLAVIIPAVQSMAELYCNRVFDSTTYTGATAEKHNGTDSPILCLRNAPVTTLTSISVVDAAGNSTTIDSDSYTLDADAGVVQYEPASVSSIISDEWGVSENLAWVPAPRFPMGHQNISVVYVGGYTSQTMPAGLKMAMYQAVDIQLGMATAGIGVGQYESERLGEYAITRYAPEAYTATIERLFGPWRRVVG